MIETLTKKRKNVARWVLYPAAAIVVTAIIWVRPSAPEDADMATRLSGAQFLAECGALEEAEKTCDEVIARTPGNLHAWLIKGLVSERRRDWKKAIAHYCRAFEIVQGVDADLCFDIRLSIADIQRRSGHMQDALIELARIEETRGQDARIERLRGVVALDQGELDVALAKFVSYSQDRPSDESHSLLATTLLRQGRLDAAEETLRSTSKSNPVSWPVWRELARACHAAGQMKQARSVLTEYVARDRNGGTVLGRDPFWAGLAKDRLLEGVLE